MSVLVLGDIHLGLPAAPGLDWAVSMLEAGARAGAEGFICAGDVIDRAHYTADTYGEVTAFFERAVELFGPVHFIAGNHDTHHELTLPRGVVVHEAHPHSFRYHGITVHTAAVAQDPDPRSVITAFPARGHVPGPHLGVLHTSLTGDYSRKPCLPATVEDLTQLGYDAWVLAHVHRPIELHQDPFIGWVGMGSALLVDATKEGVEVARLGAAAAQ